MICSFHFNNLLCVLPARQSSSIIIPCNIDCFKERVKRLSTSLRLNLNSFHSLSTSYFNYKSTIYSNDKFKPNNNNDNRYEIKSKSNHLLTIVYIFMWIVLFSISTRQVSAASQTNHWSQSNNRYFVNSNNNNNNNYNQNQLSINDRHHLSSNQQQPYFTSSSSSTQFKYNAPNSRPGASPSLIKQTQRINNTAVLTKKVTNNHGDSNIISPSRILNSGDFLAPTSFSTSVSSSSSSVHFPPVDDSIKVNGQVNGYISVASSVLPETLYQKTLKRQSSSASTLNGLYTSDERTNASSNSPSSSSSSLHLSSSALASSHSSSLTNSALSHHSSTPFTLTSSSSPSSSSSRLPSHPLSLSESPLLMTSSSSPSPYLPSSSAPTPSSLSGNTLGYHLTEDRYTSIDIRDLLRKELDERVMEQQKAKQLQHQHQQSTPLPSPSVNLFALLPPKKDDLDRLASFNNHNKHHEGSSQPTITNKINGITNGHSRSPPGVNILVFKPNTPSKVSNEETSDSGPKNWGETFGLPPRIPLKPSVYNEPSFKNSSMSIDNRHKTTFNYNRGGNNNFNTNNNNHHHISNSNGNDGFRVFSDKDGGDDFGINYITRNDETGSSVTLTGKPSSTTTSTSPSSTSKNNGTLLAIGGSGTVIKKVPSDGIDYSTNDLNNNNIGTTNGNERGGNRPNGNNHDRYDYDYEGHGMTDGGNGTLTSSTDQNNVPDESFVHGEAYRLTTERLAYILIGSCCALSILCLIIVAFSIRCRDMCDEYKAWKKAEKLAMLNYRYQTSHARQRLRSGGGGTTSGPGRSGAGGGGPEANFFSHRTLGEQDSNLSYPPIKASRPIFGPSCCCCPAPGSSGGAWHGRGTETCPRGYFHPCPRGKLPFGAASSIQAFPRSHVPAAAVTNNFPSDEDDSLNASIIEDGRVPGGLVGGTNGGSGPLDGKGVVLDSSEGHHGHLNQCTCVEPPTNGFDAEPAIASTSTGQPSSNRFHHNHHNHHNHHQHHGQASSSQQQSGSSQPQASSSTHHHDRHHQQHLHQQRKQQQLSNGQENDKSFNPSWLQSSIIVDELHRKHSQLVRENAKSPKSRNPEDQRYIFWSENQDRLI